MILVFLILVALVRSSLGIGVCCKIGEVLVLDNGDIGCQVGGSRWLVTPKDTEDKPMGLPSCDSGHLVQSLVEETTKIPSDACLGIYLDTEQEFPVLVHCNSSTSTINLTTSIPTIKDLRKCCPPDRVYDVDKKFCVDDQGNFDVFRGKEFIDVYNGPPTCEHALLDYKVTERDVYNDGSGISIGVRVKGQKKNVTINMDNACIDAGSSSDFIVARICTEADYCTKNTCIRKCCPENKINSKCVDPPENVSIENFRTSLALAVENSSVIPKFDVTSYALVIGKPCEQHFLPDPDEKWEIGSQGEFLLKNYPPFTYDSFCFDLIYNNSYYEDGFYPFYCSENTKHYIPDPQHDITSGLVIVSCIFLLVTLLVYACLPSLQNLHGKTVMCHVFSLLCAYISLAIINFGTHRVLENINENVADASCIYAAYLMLFWFHSTFFWLNVMCFDIWWTFGGVQGPASAATKRRQQRNRFLTYCAYAWGLAFVLTSISIVVDKFGFSVIPIGRERCWFDTQSMSEIVFFIGPISLTLVVNTIFFIVTSYRCSKVKAEIKRVMANVKDPTARKFHSDKTRLIMNLKLFVVMGIPWVLENLSAYLQHYMELPPWFKEAFYAADVVNALQGLWIFIMFVLKPKVYRALRKRCGIRSKSSTTNTLTVQGLHPAIRKSPSNSTLTSNFLVSSTTTA